MTFKFKTPDALLVKEINKQSKAINKGTVRALNKTAITVRKNSVTSVGEVLNLKTGPAKKALKIRRATVRNKVMRIQAFYAQLRAIDYKGTRQVKKGVSVLYRKDKGRFFIRGAFITRVGGHRGAFRRRSRKRLPIKEVLGPPVQDIFAERTDKIIRLSDGVLDANLNREIDFALSKR